VVAARAGTVADGRRERLALATDLDQPTVVLVDNLSDNWSKWLADNPDVLRDYRLVATISDIEIRSKAH
jgi:hypothetical protein